MDYNQRLDCARCYGHYKALHCTVI